MSTPTLARLRIAWLGSTWVNLAVAFTVARPASVSAKGFHEDPKPAARGQLTREAFNQAAIVRALPLFWIGDGNRNGVLDPSELAVTFGPSDVRIEEMVQEGAFTPAFESLYQEITAPFVWPNTGVHERKRRESVRAELARAHPSLVVTHFQVEIDYRLYLQFEKVARRIEALYAKQRGVFGLESQIPADDPTSRALFFRNQGPDCQSEIGAADPDCHALPQRVTVRSGLYPEGIQGAADFCRLLENRSDAEVLLSPFVVVRFRQGKKSSGDIKQDDLVAVPFHLAFASDVTAIAEELRKAAALLEGVASEHALRDYLMAAALAFENDDWFTADRAWKAMASSSSKWYVRIAPDEVFADPCRHKGGFHFTIARIDPRSGRWKRKLEPLKMRMERDFAQLAGPPYQAREVGFSLPDFIEIVLNAGDDRAPLDATIGQSLPNWGPVAKQGGRTVVMSNLYTSDDVDSKRALEEQMASLLCPSSLRRFDADPWYGLISTILHEAAHNLGPRNDQKTRERSDVMAFGGPLAGMLEELKAQTAALYLSEWLVDRSLLARREAEKAHLMDVAWIFGQLASGVVDAVGLPKPYAQLSAIQLDFLNHEGVLKWRPTQLAANGKDLGCFSYNALKWRATAKKMMRVVLRIKAQSDRRGAQALLDAALRDEKSWNEVRTSIQNRWRRVRSTTYIYAAFPPGF
jgi:hypothetical protein